VFEAFLAGVSAVVAVFLAHRLTGLREKSAENRRMRRETSEELLDSLNEIRRMVDRSESLPVAPAEIVELLEAWEIAWQKHEGALPWRYRHIRNSVADALGTHFGPIGAWNRLPSAAEYEVLPLSLVWWQRADDYLSYLARRLFDWGHAGSKAGRLSALGFDAWLELRERPHRTPAELM
jgi:hypothetical protein